MARAAKKATSRTRSGRSTTARSKRVAAVKKTKAAAKRTPAKRKATKSARAKAAVPKKATKATAKKAAAKRAPATKKSVAKKKAPAKKAAPKKQVAKKAPAKKAPAKKAPSEKPKAAPAKAAPEAPPKPKKKQKPEVDARQIRKIKARLEDQRQVLRKEYADLEEASMLTSQSEASGEASFDEEYADAGSFTFEREKDLSIGNNIRDLLDKVEQSLAKIENKTYGLCDNCGNPIPKARIEALPHTTLCVPCKQTEERTR